jgi:hypothetical protein
MLPPGSDNGACACGITELEVLYSARSAADRTRVKAALDAHHVRCPMPDGVYRRSRVVQEQLPRVNTAARAPPTSWWLPPPKNQDELERGSVMAKSA